MVWASFICAYESFCSMRSLFVNHAIPPAGAGPSMYARLLLLY
jgi:hypothetical protein